MLPADRAAADAGAGELCCSACAGNSSATLYREDSLVAVSARRACAQLPDVLFLHVLKLAEGAVLAWACCVVL